MEIRAWEREKGVSYLCHLAFEMRKCGSPKLGKTATNKQIKIAFVTPITYFSIFFSYLLALHLFS